MTYTNKNIYLYCNILRYFWLFYNLFLFVCEEDPSMITMSGPLNFYKFTDAGFLSARFAVCYFGLSLSYILNVRHFFNLI